MSEGDDVVAIASEVSSDLSGVCYVCTDVV